jgi:hypothetical protein
MLNPVEQSLGERATFTGGVWIQALTLLGRREVVRTVANMPPSMQYRTIQRLELKELRGRAPLAQRSGALRRV